MAGTQFKNVSQHVIKENDHGNLDFFLYNKLDIFDPAHNNANVLVSARFEFNRI